MIYLRLFSQDKFSWIMMAFMIVWMIGMAVLYFRMKKINVELLGIWKKLCLVPLGVAILHFIFCGFKGKIMLSIMFYGGIYLTSIFISLMPLLCKIKWHKITGVVVGVFAILCTLFTVAYPAITNSGTRNYSHKCFDSSFEATVENMKEYNSSYEWKEIDLEELKQEIMPEVKAAEKNSSPVDFYVALCKFTYRLQDGHSWVKAGSKKIEKAAEEKMAGNDYGMSMVRLENGETIAVCVEKNSQPEKAGIKFGTVIKKWDGKPIDEAIDEVECIYTKEYGRWPVAKNEEMYKPIFLAGKGGPSMEVTYVDQNGKEQNTRIEKIGNYRERLEKVAGMMQGKNVLKDTKNLETKMLDEQTGYLRIDSEETNLGNDLKAYIIGENPYAKQLLVDKIEELKKQGMSKLIIDVRNNTGGYTSMVREWASLFTKERFFVNSMADKSTGKTRIIKKEYVEADGRFADLSVIVLTNSRCVSAGDYLVDVLGRCSNVNIKGMTTSCGSSQPVGGNCVLTKCYAEVRYPNNWMLDENGNWYIDTKSDRISRLPNDEIIKLTLEAAKIIFEEEKDYELNYCKNNPYKN